MLLQNGGHRRATWITTTTATQNKKKPVPAGAGDREVRGERQGWRSFGEGCRFKIFVIDKTQDALHNTIRHLVGMRGQVIAVKVEKARLDDGGNRVGVNFREGMVIGHIERDAAGMERQPGDAGCNGPPGRRSGGWRG